MHRARNQRVWWDLSIPIMTLLAGLTLPFLLHDLFQKSAQLDNAEPIPGIIVEVNKHLPFETEEDHFYREYVVVKYVNHKGRTRHLRDRSGAWPGYFHVGQTVQVGRVDGHYVILDRWFLWQGAFVSIPLLAIWLFIAPGYYLFWRSRLLAKERKWAKLAGIPVP